MFYLCVLITHSKEINGYLMSKIPNKQGKMNDWAIHVPYRPQQISLRQRIAPHIIIYEKIQKWNLTNSYTKFQVSISNANRKVWKTKYQQRAKTPVKVGQALQNSKLIYIMLWPIHIPNFMPISQKTTEKSLESLILAKGNNSRKSRSSVTKLKLDLYYVKTNSYTKFHDNISKDSRE